MTDVTSIVLRVDHCEEQGFNGWFKENGLFKGKPEYANLTDTRFQIDWDGTQWRLSFYAYAPPPYGNAPSYAPPHDGNAWIWHYKHPDKSATRPRESGWVGYFDNKPSAMRITYVANPPDGWQKQWGANKDTIVYRNAARNETVSNVDKANESDRKFQAMSAAPNAPSPWVKKWDDQQRKVVYHHPQRNETVLTVADAHSSDQKAAMSAAPNAPSPWVKKWNDQQRKVVYHHPQRNETVLTVANAHSSDQKATIAAATNAPSPWVKKWDDQQRKVVYHHPQRNETVLTMADVQSSDQKANLSQKTKFMPGLSADAAVVDMSDAGLLGTGHFAVVRRGTFSFRSNTLEPVAFKIINGSTGAISDTTVKAVAREVETAAEIKNHPNVVTVFGAVNLPGIGVAVVMDLLTDGTLSALLLDKSRPLSWQQRLSLARDITRGMKALHANRPNPIVHRDLKGSNVLLWVWQGKIKAKIADFGLAKFTSASTGNTYGVGTLSHSAPETFKGVFDEASDVFAFGVLLYELATRVTPWATEGKSTQEISKHIMSAFTYLQDLEDDFGLNSAAQLTRWLKNNPLVARRPSLALVEVGCPQTMLTLMQECWGDEPTSRPTFVDAEAALATAPIVDGFATLNIRDNWESAGKKGTDSNKLFLVAPTSSEFKTVLSEFNKTLSSKTIDSLHRVENGYQHESYHVALAAVKTMIGAAFDPATMQRKLFHGSNAIDMIVNSPTVGFLPLLSGTSTGAVYGDGSYFARDAKYSDDFSLKLSNGQRQMLVVEVVVGRSTAGKAGMKVCPLVPGETYVRYDSLVNRVRDPTIFVVQHTQQAYPAYVITYH